MKREVKRVRWDAPRPSWLRVAWVEAWESRHQIRTLPRWVLALAGILMLLVTLHWETSTGILESHLFSHWAKGMTFYIQPGPTDGVIFPRGGPADVRRGYTRIPEFTRMLESRGYRVAEQARFSPALEMAAKFGISPPYREPTEAGLAIEGADGSDLYEADHRNGFASYQEIPPVVARSLLFIENRELGNSSSRWSNPAIDWGRWTKAVLVYSARKVGIPVRVEGGSTLAVQVEKYRHSDEGRTGSPVDKLRQVLTASLRVYQEGPDTREERRHILVDYLNSVPLGATPEKGEIFGLNQGLSVWFGRDPNRVMDDIRSGKTPAIRARALKQVLALLCAVRAPSRYLREDHEALERRANAYVGLLAKEGVFDAEFAERVRTAPLRFVDRSAESPRIDRIPLTSKATNRIRIDLERDLGVSGLYDLNRLHLNVESTVDAGLQRDAEQLMAQFADSAYLASHGLRGEHLLSQGDPKRVIYSVLLCERTPDRNEVRVHADNLRGPFDVNEGMKMSLGSTAKLRTLVHYLQIVEKLHGEIAPLHGEALDAYARAARDPLTQWAVETMRENPILPLDSLLTRATERVYSANPGEMFFTGGGLHAFVNFDDNDNHKRMTIKDAAARSTNLVFVRLMRDVVRYHEAHLPYDPDRVLSGEDAATRAAMLNQIIDAESRGTVARAYRDYHGLGTRDALDKLLGPYRRSRRSLAILYLAWHPGAPAESLGSWLNAYAERDSLLPPERLLAMYGNTRLGLEDYAYLLGKHPLEIWTVGALARNPALTQEQLVRESADARRIASAWLFRTRNRHAQDLRLRTRFEQDAFERMTPSWRRLGFPFQRLVPSYATAIGSSADRPAALAELMGIILNDGEERPTETINRLVFAPGTPYHTALESEPEASQRLLSPSVARTARDVLRGVVANDGGTARRLLNTFHDADGRPVTMGGKTGTGDNRFDTFGRGGRVIASRVVSRTSAFTFYIGDRYYGVVTASVYGSRAGDYTFTSALPLRFLELLAPSIEKRWKGAPPDQVVLLQNLHLHAPLPVQHVHPDVTLVAADD